MTAPLIPLERVDHTTVLGVRFWDAVQDRQISDDLEVFTRVAISRWPRRRAIRTLGGNYVFRDLPGLDALEFGDLGEPLLSPPAARDFWVEVSDPRRRYLSVGFEVTLPLAAREVYTGLVTSPPEAGPFGVYLFSAPTRPLGVGVAEIRGDLARNGDGEPAAHALVEAEIAGVRHYGMSDARGVFLIPLLYPMFEPGVIGSPPFPSPPTPPESQRWPVRLRVRHQRSVLRFSPDTQVPDLRSVLAQAPAGVWPTPPSGAGVPASELVTDLSFRRELVVRTTGLSTLIVEPA